MMASAQSGGKESLINELTKLLATISLELRPQDIAPIKVLLLVQIPQEQLNKVNPNEDNAGSELITCLWQSGLVSNNNLDLLIELLNEGYRPDLAEKVKAYKTTVKSVNSLQIPVKKTVEQLPAMWVVHFIFVGEKRTFTIDNLEVIKNAIHQGVDINLSDVSFATAEDWSAGYLDVMFKVHASKDKMEKIQQDALNKSQWLTMLGVQVLEVDGKSPIVIEQSFCHRVCSQSDESCRNPGPVVKSVLETTCLNQTSYHSNEAMDIILAIEAPYSVNVQRWKAVVQQCDEAYRNLDCHKRLSLITYGNHAASKPPQWLENQSQKIVVGSSDFAKENFRITDAVVGLGQCDNQLHGNSGIADAIKCACGLVEKVRPEATKVCIVTCFLGQQSSHLEYYKCCHGNDPIKLCNTLAEHGISLYIIGIATAQQTAREENYFLSGITHITGGRYFEIDDIKVLCSVIDCIVKETASIEGTMGTVHDIVIAEINNQYGDTNQVHLASHLHHQLQKRNVKVKRIEENHGFLRPISKVSERVAWANDLEDAIQGVMNMTVIYITQPRNGISTITKHVQQSDNEPDIEVSSRMVIRQLYRSAYYKKITFT